MDEATNLGPQPAVPVMLSQPTDASDYSSTHPKDDRPALPQSDAEGHHNQNDILLARIARLEKRAQLQDQALFVERAEIRRARAVQLAEDISPSTTMPLTIIVRKIHDHTVDKAKLEFLASSQVTLERNGALDMRKLSFRKAGDYFSLVAPDGTGGNPGDPYASADWVQEFVSYEDDVYPFLNVIEFKDKMVARKRADEKRRARKIAKRNSYLKGLVGRPFTWIMSRIPPLDLS